MKKLIQFDDPTIKVTMETLKKERMTGYSLAKIKSAMTKQIEDKDKEVLSVFNIARNIGFMFNEFILLPDVKKLNTQGKDELCREYWNKSYSYLMNCRRFFLYYELTNITAKLVAIEENYTSMDNCTSFLKNIVNGKIKIVNIKYDDTTNKLEHYEIKKVENEDSSNEDSSNEDSSNEENGSSAGKNNVSITARKPGNLVKAYNKLSEQITLLIDAINDEEKDNKFDDFQEVYTAFKLHEKELNKAMEKLPTAVLEALAK